MMEAGIQHAPSVVWLVVSTILSILFVCGGILVIILLLKLFVLTTMYRPKSQGKDGEPTVHEKLERSSARLQEAVVDVKRALLKMKIKQARIQNSRQSSGKIK